MFHFSRRTLWIIIYITIPLIFVLNQLGPDSDEAPSGPERLIWSLDRIEFQRDDHLWTVELPDSRTVRLTVIQDRIPAESMTLPDAEAIRTSRQGGRFLVTVVNPTDRRALETSVDFLQQWLPDGDRRDLVLSGPLTADLRAEARRLTAPLAGTGVDNQVAPQPALTRLTSPPMGSQRQLAFLLWVGVLQQRLSGYEPEVRWDHRGRPSEVLINQTLAPEALGPVTEAELEPVLAAYQSAAEQRERSGEQIHRYLVTTAVYGLPLDFLLTQPERLASITLTDVNEQRERTLSEL
ncbi:hypothetical protein [Saccharospirillum salsuginis]|uniref:Uncharacterized protein n=1 Tax=Saccharospirillum salsuginis TaxID=418750 RepID=A0A918K230_9GAMM|nr:hypothetical protein [Saccharospirillum salsuginis]GGX42105.1 hypothetical protein GCM10007392_06310 [Saccharospirillum salsuginis]